MKKNTFILLLLGILLSGCEPNDIAFYAQEPRLNFYSDKTYTFTDKDYLDKTLKATLEVQIELMGNLLTSPLGFCVETVQDTANVKMVKLELLSQYTFEAGVAKMNIPVVVECPKEIGVLYTAYMLFDLNNPGHQFEVGTVEKQDAKIGVIYNIKPNGWNDFFGIYSNSKYIFMMDYWKMTYDKMSQTNDTKAEISNAYADYKKTHGPLYDDQSPKQEIVFPS